MLLIELVAAGLVVAVAVALGTLCHECTHGLVLRLFGIPFEFEWLGSEGGGSHVRAGLLGSLASVEVRELPADCSPAHLRLAALAPLSLAVPIPLVTVGLLPDPFAVDNTYLHLAVIGWLACAIPSPQDFSLVWYAERAIAEER